MNEQLEKRLEGLKAEFESGQRALSETEARRADLQNTLLRISGAIQVLEELLGEESASAPQAGEAGDGFEEPAKPEAEPALATAGQKGKSTSRS